MIATDRDALICDLAETYHIYDMTAFKPDYIAILAVGLRNDSRIKKRLSGVDVDLNTLLLAHIVDNTAINAWFKTEDARKGKNRPRSMVKNLTKSDNNADEVQKYNTGDDFMKEWERINGNRNRQSVCADST